MKLIRHIKDLVNFFHLPKYQRKITFYSEGGGYWPHLESLVKALLKTTNNHICYLSSGDDDPGLLLKHKNFHAFKTDEGLIRNWLFENIETEVMVMTMPDLNQFQVKRSKHKVHYIYVQHSLASLHMIYRKGAFDHYDTIFCAGPHHVKEIRAMEAKYNLPVKALVEHGYARFDSIIEEAASRGKSKKEDLQPLHILIAPSWSDLGLIESGIAEKIVDLLMLGGFKVTLRPHPQTIKFAKNKIDIILKKHSNSMGFNYEDNVAGQDSLHDSDVMISDWSGAAFDYAYGLGKPVVFIDVPKKVNNMSYEEIGIDPIEVIERGAIGHVLHIENIKNITELVTKTIPLRTVNPVFNPGTSSKVGAEKIMELINE
jgi:hypothetical protein